MNLRLDHLLSKEYDERVRSFNVDRQTDPLAGTKGQSGFAPIKENQISLSGERLRTCTFAVPTCCREQLIARSSRRYSLNRLVIQRTLPKSNTLPGFPMNPGSFFVRAWSLPPCRYYAFRFFF